MDNNKHLLYYWKDFDKNLREGKVGWLGTKNPGKKVFAEFNRLLPQSANSWLTAFRWEKSTNKTFPLAILKAIEHPVVRVDADESYKEFIYYDPRQSYRLNRPTDSTRLAKFHELGSEIFHFFDKGAVSAGFVGANGIKPISDEDVETLLANSEIFQRTELSVYVKSGSWLIAQSPSLTNPAKPDANEEQLENDSSPTVPDQSSPDAEIGDKDSVAEVAEAAAEQQAKTEGAFDPSSIEDARLKTMTAIVRRRGQKVFREALFIAYNGRCAVTGCDVKEVLEAAHIFPYKGDLTNHITNGVLLRADIHTLFDLGLLAIEPESNRILVAKMLLKGPYGELHGKQAAFPGMTSQRPSNEALRWRHKESACF